MRVWLMLIAVAGLALAEYEEEDHVLVLTDDNFQQALEEFNYVLVEFYAPWCGHCKALTPEYAKAATTLHGEGSEIRLGKVDATEQTELAQSFGVKGYPTIKFFKGGKESEYNGGRTGKEIVAWLLKRTGPPAHALTTLEDAKAFTEKNEVAAIGFFEDEESDNAKAFLEAADAQDTLSFGITSSAEVAEGMEATLDSIVVFKQFDDGRADFDGEEFTVELITEFVLNEQLPLITIFNDETAPKIFGGAVHTHLLAFFPSDGEEAETILGEMRTVAKDHKGEVVFVHIDTSDESSSRVTDFFNIDGDDTPTVRLINLDKEMRKFVPTFEEITAANLEGWVQEYNDGKLKAHLNSEDVPEDWNEEAVKVVVGKNFADIVLDPTKDVFVEFYAPWCGHCKQLAPIWEDLAEHFENDENVVVAKMDSTKNEVDVVQVQGFPTLKLFRKETNEVVDYTGGRTLDDMIQYLEEQTGASDSDDSDDSDSDSDGTDSDDSDGTDDTDDDSDDTDDEDTSSDESSDDEEPTQEPPAKEEL